jgi:hypothetical protein
MWEHRKEEDLMGPLLSFKPRRNTKLTDHFDPAFWNEEDMFSNVMLADHAMPNYGRDDSKLGGKGQTLNQITAAVMRAIVKPLWYCCRIVTCRLDHMIDLAAN